MKLVNRIIILSCLFCLVISGCPSKPKVLASFWGNNLLPEQLEMTSANYKMLQIKLEQQIETGIFDNELEDFKDNYIQYQRIQKCYSILIKNVREHYVKLYAIEISNDELDFWIDKFSTSMGFDVDTLKEAEESALLDLEVMSLYLIDKEQARTKFNNTSFANDEELWQGFEMRSKYENPESLKSSIKLIKDGHIARYLFSYQVKLNLQEKAILQNIGMIDESDMHDLDWEQFRKSQMSNFNKFLLEGIDSNKNIIFHDKKLKDDIRQYVKNKTY